MPTFGDIPSELTLQIFPYLPLKGLVAAEGVCRRWKELIVVADIYAPRRALLQLYRKIVHDPLFHDLDSRPWLWENVRPFDRQAYLDHILAQHNYIPEDFRLWILEWPNKAVIACAWPGLHENYCAEDGDDIERFIGYNHLGCLQPQLCKIRVNLRRICHPDIFSDGSGDFDEYFSDAEVEDGEYSEEEGGYSEEENGNQVDCEEFEADSIADHPKDYYKTLEVFDYTPPPGPGPLDVEFPALLVWEKDAMGQIFLTLSPESPFSVFGIQYDGGEYYEGAACQYTTWISWLEAQLRRMHRVADFKPYLGGRERLRDPDPDFVNYDTWFRSQPRATPPWTKEDETKYTIAAAASIPRFSGLAGNIPYTGGVSYFPQVPYQSTYGTSGPRSADGHLADPRLRIHVAQLRLRQYLPGVIPFNLQISNGNRPGDCCEYVTIPPQVLERQCTLRTICSESLKFNGGHQVKFCQNCVIVARRVADQYPGLTIRDMVAMREYQSDCTKQALKMEDQCAPAQVINIFLLGEAAKVAQKNALDAPGMANKAEQAALAAEDAAEKAERDVQRLWGHPSRSQTKARERAEKMRLLAHYARENASFFLDSVASTRIHLERVVQEVQQVAQEAGGEVQKAVYASKQSSQSDAEVLATKRKVAEYAQGIAQASQRLLPLQNAFAAQQDGYASGGPNQGPMVPPPMQGVPI